MPSEATARIARYKNQGCPYPDWSWKRAASGIRTGESAESARVCADEYQAAYEKVAAVMMPKRMNVGRK
jgi:hypothetical protein